MGLDESFEDDRDTDQVIQDRRAAKLELEARDVRFSNQKLLQLLHDNDTDDDSYRPSKGSKADFRPPKSYDDVDTDDDLQSSLGRSQRSHSREDVPMPDQTKGF
jgi:DNA replication licensing factor MCM2